MSSAAQPLKTNKPEQEDKTPTVSKQAGRPTVSSAKAGDISSPHELTAFVETLLEQLEAKFDDMSGQILERMTQMSSRVDSLEAAIQDIINGDVSVPQSPSPIPGTPKV